MPKIHLNYTHKQYDANTILLPNYIKLIQQHHTVDANDQQGLTKLISEWALLQLLQTESSNECFDEPIIRQILLEAYPYEVEYKFLWSAVANDLARNQRLLDLFNTYYAIDYDQTVDTYLHHDQASSIASTQYIQRTATYTHRDLAVQKYISFVKRLLINQWYTAEARLLELFCAQKLQVRYQSWISGVAYRKKDKIMIKVGNNTYTTLFHELTHAINSYFRVDIAEPDIVCDHTTKTNEWLSNVVAYHCYQQILDEDICWIDTIRLDPIFFSMYIDIYKTVRSSNLTNDSEIKQLIIQQLQLFEWDLLTPDKAMFYYHRFYKFFHCWQTQYLYPKELMYYIGYRQMLELFKNSSNKQQLLANCLLGNVCL